MIDKVIVLAHITYPCGCEIKMYRVNKHYEASYRPEEVRFLCHKHKQILNKAIRKDFLTLEAWDNTAP